MPETQQRIIGLLKEIVSAQTGATAHFHVVKQYSVSHIGEGSSAATFAGYVSREVYEAGKDPLLFVTAQIPAAPTAGRLEDLPTWFALQLLAVAAGHDFVGATPVHAETALPSSEEPAA
jgi:hypothetical protein